MSYKSSHNSTHGVMFHHFHSETHPVGQGSLSAETLDQMLDWLGKRYSILDAGEYTGRLLANTLEYTDICLTFDDALLCQYDVARPVLNKRGIKAFFFVYSGPILGEFHPLEVYRYFRTINFDSMESFYDDFFALSEKSLGEEYSKREGDFLNINYLGECPFYSDSDRWFRYLRDHVLGQANYAERMSSVMAIHMIDPEHALHLLWMKNMHLQKLRQDGHIIGLHSFSHPTMIHELQTEAQQDEYQQNYEHLSEVLGEPPITMSHPCGKYSQDTLKLLEAMGIKVGFRSSMAKTDYPTKLEVPREDHANILAEMSK